MGRVRTAVGVGLTVGLLGAAVLPTPLGGDFEADVGLGWLFRIRGPAPPPGDVAVVAMNRRAADRLDLASGTREWPRALHAGLIGRLARDGAAAIVLDVFFRNPSTEPADRPLSAAIRDAGRVALSQYVERDTIASPVPAGAATVERLISPAPEIAAGAAALAPFPLPKAATQVHSFWAFLTEVTGEPTLPSVAVQLMALRHPRELGELMTAVGPAAGGALDGYLGSARTAADLLRLMRTLRPIFRNSPDAAPRAELALLQAEAAHWLAAPTARILRALVRLYAGPDRRYLNYYGPPGTVRTVPYDAALAEAGEVATALRGKVVMVGLSEDSVTDIRENFPTVFSRDDGIELSGVEILATAVANLLTSASLQPLSAAAQVVAAAAFGGAIGAVACLVTGLAGTAVVLVLGAAWFAAASVVFDAQNLWIPLSVPLLVQLPLAVVVGLALKYLTARRGLAFYLPRDVADDLARGKAPETTRHVRGVCLATDISGYTTLAERLDPRELMALMNAYWSTVGAPVERHGGRILNNAGDSMMCAWVVPPGADDSGARRAACRAAQAMRAAVDAFNAAHPDRPLPTRIGLQAGEFALGPIGGEAHREFGAIGDALNTAARIRDLNKEYGTRVLASAAVVAGLGDVAWRAIHVLPLRGRSEPVQIVELTDAAATPAHAGRPA